MNILIVHPQMALYGGAELVVVRLAQYLKTHGHTITVLTLSAEAHSEYRGIDFILPAKKNQTSYRLRSGLTSIYDVLKIHLSLQKLCKANIDDFDVTSVHNFPATWAVPSHKKVVWMCNEVPDLWHSAKVNGLSNKLFNVARYLDSKIVRAKKLTSVVADNTCASIFRKRYGLQPEIIPYGIDGKFFAQQKHAPSDKQFRVICTSMISPSKDQLRILQAVMTLRSNIPNIKLVLSGYKEATHSYSIMLDKYIADNSLDVEYVAMTDRVTLRSIYGKSTVAVFAGKGQGSWLSPFEQLSMGIPIIVTPNLTCSELIRKENIGTITNNIHDALLRVNSNYPYFKEQALRGQAFVLNELTWDNFGRKMEAVLQKACK